MGRDSRKTTVKNRPHQFLCLSRLRLYWIAHKSPLRSRLGAALCCLGHWHFLGVVVHPCVARWNLSLVIHKSILNTVVARRTLRILFPTLLKEIAMRWCRRCRFFRKEKTHVCWCIAIPLYSGVVLGWHFGYFHHVQCEWRGVRHLISHGLPHCTSCLYKYHVDHFFDLVGGWSDKLVQNSWVHIECKELA